MKFKVGQLIYDPKYDMVGMLMGIWTDSNNKAWYQVHMFGDDWCSHGKTRDYQITHTHSRLEAYGRTPQR